MNVIDLILTDSAVNKITSFLSSKEEAVGIKFGIKNKGCSGMAYSMEYVYEHTKEDSWLKEERNGINLFIDEKHIPFIAGSTVDYLDGLEGAGFKFSNPNAVNNCGCGNSFKTKESEGCYPSGQCG